MPGMLEVPPFPLASIAGREPVLRLRHAITNTNYYVQVYAESAPGVQPEPREDQESEEIQSTPENLRVEAEDSGKMSSSSPAHPTFRRNPLLDELPPSTEREWVPAGTIATSAPHRSGA